MPVALTIAGSDPSGGAGLQADLRTFHRHGVYGMSVVTLLTVQNTQRVVSVDGVPSELVLAQLDAVVEDIPPAAAKTGALGSAAVIEAVADRARRFAFPLVVDPVMVSKHGDPLIDDDAVQVLKEQLLPHATLVTPNLQEAAKLADREVSEFNSGDPDWSDAASIEAVALAIAELGPANVLIKGIEPASHPHGESVGHSDDRATDLLLADGRFHRLAAARVDTPHLHGAGCVLSAAITAGLARGRDLVSAANAAKQFVASAIASAPELGKGRGPLNLFAEVGEA